MKHPLFMLLPLLSMTAAVADVADELRCQETAFSKSVETKNLPAFRALLDDDARFIGASVNRGVDEITAAWSIFFAEDGPTIIWRPMFIEVLKDENLALSRGPYRMTTTDADGEIVHNWGTFNSVWRRQADGSWKVVFDAGNSSAEAPSADARELLQAADEC